MASESDVFGYFIPNSILSQIFSETLSIDDISRFDIAICNRKKRPQFLDCLKSFYSIWVGNKETKIEYDTISWLESRSMKMRHLKCFLDNKYIVVEDIGIFGGCLHWLSIQSSMIEDSIFSKMIQNCNNLKSLNLSFCGNISDVGISTVLEACPNLLELNLSVCYKITDISILKIGEKYLTLHSLNISGNRNITDIGLMGIANGCPHLHSLYLCDVKVSNLGLVRIAEKCPNLHTLDLSDCRRITDMGVVSIVEKCRNITDLDLSYCWNITDRSISTIAHCCQYLKTLDICNCPNITRESISELQKMRHNCEIWYSCNQSDEEDEDDIIHGFGWFG
jgi:hypothetical protein